MVVVAKIAAVAVKATLAVALAVAAAAAAAATAVVVVVAIRLAVGEVVAVGVEVIVALIAVVWHESVRNRGKPAPGKSAESSVAKNSWPVCARKRPASTV